MSSSSKASDLQKNVAYCLRHLELNFDRKELAKILEVNQSTLTRWLGLQTVPYPSHVSKLAQLTGLTIESFKLPHGEFTGIIYKIDSTKIFMDFRSVEQKVTLGAIEKWKHLWDECAKKHAGSYFMYTRLLTDAGFAAVSLLRIMKKTDRGIRFEVYNVDDRVPPKTRPIIYRYVGLMFPVGECLQFYGEEQSGDEILSIITSSAQVPGRSALCGYLSAVGVANEIRRPAGTKMAAYFHSKKMIEVDDVLDEVGIVRVEGLAKEIQALI